MTTFLQATAIVFREGLEAWLMIIAVIAYLRGQNLQPFLVHFAIGVAIALLAAAGLVFVLSYVEPLVENFAVEGFTLLLSALVMLYVSGWLFAQRSGRSWQAFIKSHTQRGAAGRLGYAFMLVAFAIVFREAAETVIFLNALSMTARGSEAAIAAGAVTALVCLTLASVWIARSKPPLPLRTVFVVTSAFFFFLAIVLLGDALASFQQGQWISATRVETGASFIAGLGLNPTWEALGLQASAVVLAFIGAHAAASSSGASNTTPEENLALQASINATRDKAKAS